MGKIDVQLGDSSKHTWVYQKQTRSVVFSRQPRQNEIISQLMPWLNCLGCQLELHLLASAPVGCEWHAMGQITWEHRLWVINGDRYTTCETGCEGRGRLFISEWLTAVPTAKHYMDATNCTAQSASYSSMNDLPVTGTSPALANWSQEGEGMRGLWNNALLSGGTVITKWGTEMWKR